MTLLFTLILLFQSAEAGVRDASSNRWSVSVGFETPSLDTSIYGPQKTNRLAYTPYTTGITKVGVGYDMWAASYGFKGTTKDGSESLLTKYEDYQFRFYPWNLAVDLFYQKYTGYFVQDDSLGSQAMEHMPNMTNTRALAQATYIFDKNYSISSAYSTGDIQTKSAGSILANLAFGYNEIKNDASIIPTSTTFQYGRLQNVSKIQNTSALIGGGAGYNLILGPFYIGVLGLLQLGNQQAKYTLTTSADSDAKAKKTTTGTVAKAAIGFNRKSWKLNLQLQRDATTIENDDGSQVEIATMSGGLYFTLRF